MSETDSQLRIGELSRRVGVDPALLRAWEKRYGLLQPRRSEGNFRLYSPADVARVWAMKRHLARGLAAAEAAKLALAEEAPTYDGQTPSRAETDAVAAELREQLALFDEGAAHEILDRAFALSSLEEVLTRTIIPCLREIGHAWERGEISVAQEHFASTLLRTRLLALARGWSSGSGRTAVLACPSGEQHDIGLICFGLILWRQGWRIVYLGQETPASELPSTVSATQPDVLVLAASSSRPLEEAVEALRPLGAETLLAIGGAGANAAIADQLGAMVLEGDMTAAARTVAAITRGSQRS
jgi:MerR family transcriptional regulator, light-induced transcriptional regulator